MANFIKLRDHMVDVDLAGRGIRDARVLAGYGEEPAAKHFAKERPVSPKGG